MLLGMVLDKWLPILLLISTITRKIYIGVVIFLAIVNDIYNHRIYRYVRTLEQSVLDVLLEFGVEGRRDAINSGVFVGTNKISAVGITASRWITMHGISVNLKCNMDGFAQIVPCGISAQGYGVCRLSDLIGRDIDYDSFSKQWLASFARNFNIQLTFEDDAPGFLQQLQQLYPDAYQDGPVSVERQCT
jgi:lipoyl(octanoyl) transferase